MSRRISTFTDEYGNPTSIPLKIMTAWESPSDVQDPSDAPRRSVPRRMSVEEIAGLIDAALEESSTQRNSVVTKRDNISRDQVLKSATNLADIINRSIEDRSISVYWDVQLIFVVICPWSFCPVVTAK